MDSLPSFFHILKSGVAEGMPAVQLKIENLVFVKLVVSNRKCEFAFDSEAPSAILFCSA
jgi:hypothetical protein